MVSRVDPVAVRGLYVEEGLSRDKISQILGVNHSIITLNLAYLLGWIIGDGYANRREIDAIVSLRESKLVEPLLKSLLERFCTVFVVP
jgi:hypothetical protein